ncbi:hypothetical protein Rhal01_00211 [Rubritalea halochordaticola]|uniref:Uncharacterized protein n=1 Tax=Rubritalea halochordaticola TaxID=714537 RepID=A0ABP9UUH6_9BACT
MSSTPDLQQLADLLRMRLSIIGNTELREQNPEEQLRQLQQVSESITAFHKEHRGHLPAQLNHFLTQSSLSKALDFIEQGM